MLRAIRYSLFAVRGARDQEHSYPEQRIANGEQRTATHAVRENYYGRPVIKAPHWRWLIVGYFFLGGMAGASYTIGTIAGFARQGRPIERVARYVAWLAFIPCPLLLVLDLGRPTRFLNMLRVLKLRSPMSLGSWALVFAGLFATVTAAFELLGDLFHREVPGGLRRAAGVAGLPFNVFLAGYTGVLLAATNVPLWWRASPFLAPTFISSAFSTSLAAISVGLDLSSGEEDTADAARRLARAEALCLATEAVCMTAMVARTGKIGRPLTAGKLGTIFWPVTYCGGVLVPLVLHASGLARGKPAAPSRRALTAGLVLAGGFALRLLMVFAGRESARRPEDYFAMTGGRGGREGTR